MPWVPGCSRGDALDAFASRATNATRAPRPAQLAHQRQTEPRGAAGDRDAQSVQAIHVDLHIL